MNEDLEQDSQSLAAIYAQKVRASRTRSCTLEIPQRENDVSILHTLLGIELKVGRRRFACPDLATARYMRVFARLGCPSFAIPYDITRISTLADELETAWQRALLTLETGPAILAPQTKRQNRSRLLKTIRSQIQELGPGDKMPEFKLSTKQRET